MHDLFGLIAALLSAWRKRFAERAPVVGRPSGDVPAERTAQPGSRVPLRESAPLPEGRPAAVSPRPAGPPAQAPAMGSSPEAGLVGALFATPQSLVAAFIVAEVLAKPVALRDE